MSAIGPGKEQHASDQSALPHIPPLYCPISLAIHPEAKAIDDATVAFMERHGLSSPHQRVRLAAVLNGMAGRLAPHGSREKVQLLSDLLLWFLNFDDLADEGALAGRPDELLGLMLRLQRTLDAPGLPIDQRPHTLALHEIRLRLDEIMPAQVEHWVTEMRGFFLAEAHRAVANTDTNSRRYDVSDHVLNRLYAGGALAVVALLPGVEGIVLPPWARGNPRFQALAEIAACISVWDSDLFSYPKELQNDTKINNIVHVLLRAREVTEQEAVTAAVAMRNQLMDRFFSLSSAAADDETLPVARYARCLAQYLRGALDWYLLTTRYQAPAGRSTLLPDVCDSPAPPTDLRTPMGIPSIAWWWDDDITSGHRPPQPGVPTDRAHQE
ncbi:terpene synthase family protein [Streptomyces sp. NPDC057623]|uniref:terpene synthase family protein n=1 Tax=Streptomyces sp. NPDC057623 TaxID=3346187 RepID=UPI00369AF11B